MRSMSKQRNKIIFAIVISMMISACGVKEDVQKERENGGVLCEKSLKFKGALKFHQK